MNRFLKRAISILLVFISCITTSSCIFKDHVYSWDVRHDAEAWFECIKNKDAEALMEYFSPYIKENRREETITELNSIFEFIDGNIVSYKYSSGSLMEKKTMDIYIIMIVIRILKIFKQKERIIWK